MRRCVTTRILGRQGKNEKDERKECGLHGFFGGHLDQGTTRALKEVSVALDAKVRVNSLMPRVSAVLRPADLRVRVSSDLLRVDFSLWSG